MSLFFFQNVCGSDFKIYLEKWNVDPNAIPDCCWPTYRKSTCGTQIESDVIAENDVNTDSAGDWKAKLWSVLENTKSGWGTKVRDRYVFCHFSNVCCHDFDRYHDLHGHILWRIFIDKFWIGARQPHAIFGKIWSNNRLVPPSPSPPPPVLGLAFPGKPCICPWCVLPNN